MNKSPKVVQVDLLQ